MQYSAIAILHTSEFTTAHSLGFLVFTSRILATGLSQSHCNFNHTWSLLFTAEFLSCHHSAAANSEDSTRLLSTAVLYSVLLCFCYSCPAEHFLRLARTPRKTPHSLVKNSCLLIRYLVMNVLLLFRASAFAAMCLASRCLAVGIHVTIFSRFIPPLICIFH
jgi:hypothetical protein